MNGRKNQPVGVKEFEGMFTALITPMHANGQLDYRKLEMLIEDQIVAGVDGIVMCGTTGQSATLGHDFQIHVAETAFHMINGRKKLIVGGGSNSTSEAIYLANGVENRIGPTTFLEVTGYYNNPTQNGLIKHFNDLADSLIYSSSNFILYDVKGRTASYMLPSTVIELSKNRSIIGLKDASGKDKLDDLAKKIKNTDPDSFRVVSGEDDLVVKIMEMGGFGVISASANAAPRYFKAMTDEALNAKRWTGDYSRAYEMQKRIIPLINAVFAVKNPIPLSYMFNSGVRSPLCREDDAIREKVDSAIALYTPQELGINFKKYQQM
jgi:4-hydroxy-tetrahydrodipicolinate synthase